MSKTDEKPDAQRSPDAQPKKEEAQPKKEEAQPKKEAWAEALSLPGANGSGGLTDITEQIYPAAADRLRLLVLRRCPDEIKEERARALEAGAFSARDPRLRCQTLLFMGGILAVSHVYGTSAEDIGAALHNADDPMTRRVIRGRLLRASRLLDKIVKKGCFIRGEVIG